MATAVLNPHLHRLRGKIGGLVYKWYGDRLVVTRVPVRTKKKPTKKLQAVYHRFRRASEYAQKAKEDPQLRAIYGPVAKERHTSLRSVAISDYQTTPKIDGVSTASFHGAIGEEIGVLMRDAFPLKTVAVDLVLRDADGREIERGPARRDGKRSWTYAATKSVSPTKPITVEVTATDRFHKAARCSFTGLPGARRFLVAEPE